MSGERIETAGDLDALPTGTILRNEQGVAFEVADEEHGRLLYGTNGTVLRDLPPFVHSWPLTVVYCPDRDLIAEAEERGARAAEAALTKALGQRDAVAVTAERMTSYARQAEAVLREVAALADESRRTGKRLSALEVSDILARTQQTGADR